MVIIAHRAPQGLCANIGRDSYMDLGMGSFGYKQRWLDTIHLILHNCI